MGCPPLVEGCPPLVEEPSGASHASCMEDPASARGSALSCRMADDALGRDHPLAMVHVDEERRARHHALRVGVAKEAARREARPRGRLERG